MADAQPWLATRLDTPGIEHVTHFNNAGAALPARAVLEAQHQFLDLEARSGGYEAAEKETQALRRPYTALAKMLNCSPEEIGVCPSATHAWNQVFFGIPFQQGDIILTCQHEYGSNYIAFMQVSKRTGAKIEVIPEDDKGDLDLEALKALCTRPSKPSLIAITHIPTNCGRVYNAQAVGQLARAHSIPYLLDACQSVGQMPLDVATLGCDWLTGTSRKYLRGPRGLGFLYASKSIMKRFPEPAALDNTGATWQAGGTYSITEGAKRYEFYEKSFAAVAGLGVAVEYYLGLGSEAVWARIQTLASLLRIRLAALPGVTLHDAGRELCGIVAFTKEGVDPASACEQLRALGINVKQTPQASTRLDFEARKLPAEGMVRASVHYYNTEQEVIKLVEAVSQLRASKGLRGGVNSALGLLLGSGMWPMRR